VEHQTSLSFGHVEDKQWIAVNHIPGSLYQDHVYAMWTTFNGANGNGKIMVAVSRDRGQTFSKAVQLSTPSATTPGNTYVYPSIGPDGTVYVAFEGGFDLNKNKVGEHLRDEVDGRRADVGPVRGRGLADRELAWLLPADELPGRNPRELRRESNLFGPSLPDL